MIYAIFDNKGMIIKTVSCAETMIALQILEGEDYIPVDTTIIDDTKFYIIDKQVAPRPTFSERIQGTNILDLPIPTTVTTNGNSYTITDGSAELSFSLPGTYKVYLSSFPYQDKVVEVTQV